MKTLLLSLLSVATTWAASPAITIPAAFRDLPESVAANVESATSNETHGEWWRLFDDPALDRLVQLALTANQDLHGAAARVEASRAAAGDAGSGYWPQLAAHPAFARERASTTIANVPPEPLSHVYRAPVALAWEIDLFGRVRHLAASARADAAATEAAFAAVRLALTVDVAVHVFSLRGAIREREVVQESVALRREALEIARARFAGGLVADLDVARAETELAAAQAESADIARRLAALENALAVLVGAAAPDVTLSAELAAGSATAATHGGAARVPRVPAGLPAVLLQRRPDIAAAGHSLSAAGERIGVARAAFFPALSLTGSAGFASGDLGQIFAGDSRAWGIGPSLYLPIFQGGRNRANLARRRAEFAGAEAAYRQQVLIALREVQDALTAMRLLDVQSAAQVQAVAAARRAAGLAQTRYTAGFVSQLEVIDAQRTLLDVEREAVRLEAIRLNTSVALIKALGGGWTLDDDQAASSP